MQPTIQLLTKGCEIKNLTKNINEETFDTLANVANEVLIEYFTNEKSPITEIILTDTKVTPQIESSYCESIRITDTSKYNIICILLDEIDLLEENNGFIRAVKNTLQKILYKPADVKYNKHNYAIMALLHEMGHAKMFMEDGILNRQEIFSFMFEDSREYAKAYRNLPQEKYADNFAKKLISKKKYRYFLK